VFDRLPEGVDEADWYMDYRNADGSLAEMCGNGARLFGRYLVDAGYAPPGRLVVATRGGPRSLDVPAGGDVTVDMGPPAVAEGPPVPVRVGGRAFEAVAVSMGNPHAVCLAPQLSTADLAALDLSAAPEVPSAAFPDGVNVEVVVPAGGTGAGRGGDRLAMRVHERGVGETLSCGTGACAAVVGAALAAGRRPPVSFEVTVPGGVLTVVWTPATILLRGPAVAVADGVLRPEWMHGV
jgi:diaminopimelate epimerase